MPGLAVRQPRIAPTPTDPAGASGAVPWRCRMGMHRWLPLALSLGGRRHGPGVFLCRDCPAVRRIASFTGPTGRG
jgi:hypothetical protein